MMKQKRSIVGWQHLVLALAGILFGLLEPAYCQDTVLLLQQTDPRGGAVSPDIGVHHFDLDSEVLLTAVPKPGYFFVYWIGDVSDPTADRTIVYLDAPKIVVAVFARSEFAFSLEEVMMIGGGGRGGLRPSAGDYGNQGYSGSNVRPIEFKQPRRTPWNPEVLPQAPLVIPDEFPIPGGEPDEFPVPHMPEPATALLLGLGSLFFIGRRTKR
jgi:hypothetical protein